MEGGGLEEVPETYYEILGIARGASDREVKQAYRTLARRFHPDVCHEEGAGDRFRRIHEAFRVLSDPGERGRYDELGHEGYRRYAAGHPGRWGAGPAGDFRGFGDAFDFFFPGREWGSGDGFRPRSSSDILVRLSITLGEAAGGCEKDIEVPYATRCEACAGSGSSTRCAPPCPGCGGTGRKGGKGGAFPDPLSPPCELCGGRGRVPEFPCGECGGWGETQVTRRVTVRVPAGIDTGKRLRIQSLGGAGDREIPGGDLYVEVGVLPHDRFTRRGDDLETPVPLTPARMILGSLVAVETLDGRIIEVEIPPGIPHDGTVRIPGEGMRSGERKGDLIVRIRWESPGKITARERALYRRILDIEEKRGAGKTGLIPRYFSKIRDPPPGD